MARKRSSRRRRNPSNLMVGVARPSVALSPTEAFERTLGQTNDSSVLRGKILITSAVSSTPTFLTHLSPFSLGARSSALAGVFSRYRVKAAILKFAASSGGTGTSLTSALGILDEPTGEGDAPGNLSATLELRCSASYLFGQTQNSYVMYTPVDKTKWYYCNTGATGSDGRLVFPAAIYVAGAGAGTLTVEIDYTLVFAGADDVGSA